MHGREGAGGVFARNFCSVRLPEWSDEAVAVIHYFIRAVRATGRVQKDQGQEAAPTRFHFFCSLFDHTRVSLGFGALRGAASSRSRDRPRLDARRGDCSTRAERATDASRDASTPSGTTARAPTG